MLRDFLELEKDPVWNILIRFLVNMFVLFVLIRGIYFKYSKKKRQSFPLFLMGIMIFLMCILLRNVELSLGVGFGLFALFSILRYRTRNISSKDMSYYFAIIGVSAINSLAQFYHPVRGPILINSILLLSVLLLEISFKKHKLKKRQKTPAKEVLLQGIQHEEHRT
jgi:hypothetical protein